MDPESAPLDRSLRQCLHRVIENRLIGTASRALIVAIIALHDTKTHYATISYGQIRKLTGIDRWLLSRRISGLIAAGELERIQTIRLPKHRFKHVFRVRTCAVPRNQP
jgi:hypothetical protein